MLVVSAAGVQSAGKSTLLNTLFGVNMETSVGCCTRGVNIAIVPSEGDWKVKSDYVMVMDTEGLCNPNLKHFGEWYKRHNNWLASISMLAPNVCCILSNNEDDTLVRDVIAIPMLCYHDARHKLTRAGFNKRNVFFVYNRVNPVDAEKHLNKNRESMIETLKSHMNLAKTLRESGMFGFGELELMIIPNTHTP